MMNKLTPPGTIVEAIGYGGRAINASETSGQLSKGPYIIQALLLLLGPPFYAASIYMVLGRLIRLLEADRYSMVRLKWLTKIFLFGDVVSILAQGMGKCENEPQLDKSRKRLTLAGRWRYACRGQGFGKSR